MTIESSSLERNLLIYQGDNFPFKVYYSVDGTPVDFTGWTGVMKLKKNFQDVTAALTLTTGNGITWQDGAILISMTPSQTLALSQVYYYDLVMTSPDASERITPIFGQAIIRQSVSL
jgi:hypothetical protein